jgi:membrane fusion protein (multidrug efflux system)
LYGIRIAKAGCNPALGRIEVVHKVIGELVKLEGWRLSEVHLRYRCPSATHVVLVLLLATVSIAAGCGRTNAAPTVPSPEVEVAKVVQKDIPIVSEWVTALDGYVNAQIQAQVTEYIVAQKYKEASFSAQEQILFQVDPRPFQALLDHPLRLK